MKKILILIFISLLLFQLNAFDFNGIWSYVGISAKGHSKYETEYSWGTVQEPSHIGFSIDMNKKIIHTNDVWSFLIDLEYDEEDKIFSFINPLTNEKETYYITEISDYEIKLETEFYRDHDPLINASPIGSEKRVHYFKLAGPENAKVLRPPIKAKLLCDVELKFLDYKGVIHNYGPVSKETIVEVLDYYEEYVPEITDLNFNYHILVNPELGGCVDPKAIEFLDDITINGYGGKRENKSSFSVE